MKSLITCLLVLMGIGSYAQSIPKWGVINHYGGIHMDGAVRVKTDVQGNNYTLMNYDETITFGSTTFPTPYFPDYAIVKHDRKGKLLSATRVFTNYGSSYNLQVTSIAVDEQLNVYVCGTFNDTVGVGALKLGITKGRRDVFVAKIDKNGNAVWLGNLGGYGRETINDIAVDKSGNIYLAGGFYGYTTDISTFHLVSVSGGNNLLLCKLNNSGTIQWIKSTISGSIDATRIVLDNNDDIILSGSARDPFSFDGITNYNPIAASALYACKFNTAGTMQWVYTPQSSGSNLKVLSMSADHKGNVMIAGRYGFKTLKFNATDSLVGGPTYQYFFASLNSAGAVNWGKGFDAHIDIDYSISVAADPDNNWYVAGRIYGYWVYNNKDTIAKSNYSSMLLKYNTTGTQQWALSTGINVGPSDIACDNANNLYQIGVYSCMACVTPFGDSLLPAQPGNPDADVYIAKLEAQELIKINSSLNVAYCIGDTLKVPFNNVDTVFKAGNSFKLELSDNSGFFTNGTLLDTKVTAKANDTFKIMLPATLAVGTHYRLRVISNAPAFYSWDNGNDITINAQPVKPVITVSADELSTIAAGGNLEWFKDGMSLGIKSGSFKPQASGIYTVRITNSSGCSNTSDAFWFAPTGIEVLNNHTDVNVFPNPILDGKVYIQSSATISTVSLISIDGRVLQLFQLKGTTPGTINEVTLDNKLSQGIYMIKCVTIDGKTFVKKLQVK